jgi:hypothetical protein
VNQGTRGDCFMKKTEGRKSRDTVPLIGVECFFFTECTVVMLGIKRPVFNRFQECKLFLVTKGI